MTFKRAYFGSHTYFAGLIPPHLALILVMIILFYLAYA